MQNKCWDCGIKISAERVRCEQCFTNGFAEDIGLSVDEMFYLLKTDVDKLAKTVTQSIDKTTAKAKG